MAAATYWAWSTILPADVVPSVTLETAMVDARSRSIDAAVPIDAFERRTVTVTLAVTPESALVRVDGVALAARQLELTVGQTVAVSVSAPGFATVERTLTAARGEERIDIELVPTATRAAQGNPTRKPPRKPNPATKKRASTSVPPRGNQQIDL